MIISIHYEIQYDDKLTFDVLNNYRIYRIAYNDFFTDNNKKLI